MKDKPKSNSTRVVDPLPANTGEGAAEQEPTTASVDGPHVDKLKTLNYTLFRPSVGDLVPVPLVVMLHGCTQNGKGFAAGTRMDAMAEEHGMFVLYPSQSVTANANLCWNWYESAHQHHGSGEPALLNALIGDVLASYPIDPEQVFIAGFCAGGAMALIMVQQYPDMFAAVGVHSGLPTGTAASMPEALAAMLGFAGNSPSSLPFDDVLDTLVPALSLGRTSKVDGQAHAHNHVLGSTIPLIVFHGERDHTVNCSNGDRIISDWLASDAANSKPNRWIPVTRQHSTSAGRHSVVTVYSSQRKSVHIGCEYWKQAEGDHAWSGGDGTCSFTDAGGPDASAEMIRFFLAAAST